MFCVLEGRAAGCGEVSAVNAASKHPSSQLQPCPEQHSIGKKQGHNLGPSSQATGADRNCAGPVGKMEQDEASTSTVAPDLLFDGPRVYVIAHEWP